jgi:hypothetical protein
MPVKPEARAERYSDRFMCGRADFLSSRFGLPGHCILFARAEVPVKPEARAERYSDRFMCGRADSLSSRFGLPRSFDRVPHAEHADYGPYPTHSERVGYHTSALPPEPDPWRCCSGCSL